MTNTNNQGNNKFNTLLGLYLQRRQTGTSFEANESHLDDDAISSFVEGRLNEREAAPIMKHLVGCNMCRRVTAQLTQLSEQFEDVTETQTLPTSSNRLRDLWRTLTDRVFTLNDEAILAYRENAEAEKNESSIKNENDSATSDENEKLNK